MGLIIHFQLVAEEGWLQVNGGGTTGLIGAATEGGCSAGGIVDSVILRRFLANNAGTSFRKQVITETLPERKKGLFDQSDALVALPGGLGTLDELVEVMCTRNLSFHEKPIVVLNTNGYFDGMKQFLQTSVQNNFVPSSIFEAVHFADSPADAVHFLKSYSPVTINGSKIGSGEMIASSMNP